MNVGTVQEAATVSYPQVKTLGQQDFLQLLVTQLRLQDPLEPVKEKEFIAQLAQFGTLEGVNNLAGELGTLTNLVEAQLTQNAGYEAVGLIGREVTVSAAGRAVTGTVTGVRWVEGRPQLLIGGEAYDLSNVQAVFLAPEGREEG